MDQRQRWFLKRNISIIHFESPSQFLFRVARLRHVSGQHELLTHSWIIINTEQKIFKGSLNSLNGKTLKSMEPLLSESNFWNIWSTNVLDFVPVRTELYISIILSLLSCPSGLSWPTWWQLVSWGIHMLCHHLHKSIEPFCDLGCIIIGPLNRHFWIKGIVDQTI